VAAEDDEPLLRSRMSLAISDRGPSGESKDGDGKVSFHPASPSIIAAAAAAAGAGDVVDGEIAAGPPALTRQGSHSTRTVPYAQENPSEHFTAILSQMGFKAGEIEEGLKATSAQNVETAVEWIMKQREKKEGKKEVKAEADSGEGLGLDDAKMEILRPVLSRQASGDAGEIKAVFAQLQRKFSERDMDVVPLTGPWRCRNCGGMEQLPAATECVECRKPRETVGMTVREQLKREEEKTVLRWQVGPEQAQKLAIDEEEGLEDEELESGPWPCKFCEYVNYAWHDDCLECGNKKYLSRMFMTNDQWKTRIREHKELKTKEEAEDRQYREEWESKKKSGGTVNCLICFDDVPVRSIVFADCKHNFCLDCWNGYLTTKVKDGEVMNIKCPAPKCKRLIERKEIRARLSKELFEKFDRFHHQALMSMNPNARWCPVPDCETVMVGNKKQPKLVCPKCAHAICFLCNHDWHQGSCELATRGLVGVAADRAAFAAYALVSNIKPCPRCDAPIEKNEGCNHMTCQRCRYEFCWMCRGRYSSYHYEWWNIWGCPGGQHAWACLGDDRCFCVNCSCGCGLLGKFKRLLLKVMAVGCGLACCPFIFMYVVFHECCR